MPELATVDPAIAAPLQAAQAGDNAWLQAMLAPPPDEFEIIEGHPVPPLPNECSRTVIVTRAGIEMTLIVERTLPIDDPTSPATLDTNMPWSALSYHVVTNNVRPALHLHRYINIELATEAHSLMVNEMVRQVQETVLQRRREAEAEAQRQRMLELQTQRVINSFAVPTIWIGASNQTSITLRNSTVNTATTYNMQWQVTGTGTFHFSNNYLFQPSPEQTAKINAEREAQEKLLADANQRAEQLLLDLLGKMGFARYKRQGYVLVTSRTKPGVVYRVKGMAGIDLYERKNGKIISLKQYLCIHPRDNYPEADTVAAQVLMCRFDEDNLWKTANLHKRERVLLAPQFVNLTVAA